MNAIGNDEKRLLVYFQIRKNIKTLSDLFYIILLLPLIQPAQIKILLNLSDVIKIEYFEIFQLFFQFYILHIAYLLQKYVFFNIFWVYYNNICTHSQTTPIFYARIFS